MKRLDKLLFVILAISILALAYSIYQSHLLGRWVACTMEAKICPDGSTVGRIAPSCEFAACPNSILYRNEEYGFEINLPNSWQGYSVEKQTWQGWIVNTGEQGYSGIKLIIKNPKTTAQQAWQDIPIMIFSHEVWSLVSSDKVSISAAPIPPAKIGQNSKYVFATPPRWYGFTDAVGWEEAVKIVKTFKGL